MKTLKRPKTLYRYRITHVTGSMKNKIKVGEIVLNKTKVGEEYTWIIFNVKTGKQTGTMTGVFIGTARTKDGKKLM